MRVGGGCIVFGFVIARVALRSFALDGPYAFCGLRDSVVAPTCVIFFFFLNVFCVNYDGLKFNGQTLSDRNLVD